MKGKKEVRFDAGKLLTKGKMSSGEASSSKDGMGTEESEMGTEESEEAKASKGISSGTKPSQREIDEHERTHMPFRSWCKHCVMGRSDGNAHRKSKNHDQQEVTTVSCDYGYMTSE